MKGSFIGTGLGLTELSRCYAEPAAWLFTAAVFVKAAAGNSDLAV